MDLISRRSLILGAAGAAGATILAPRFLQRRGVVPSLVSSTQTTSAAGQLRAFDVRTFGARGDGRSDARPAIQAAIDQIAASGGGMLLIPSGTWLLSKSRAAALAINLRSNVHLVGSGAGTVLKLMDDTSGRDGCHLINVDEAKNVSISDLVIDGNRAAQRSSGHGIRSAGVDGFVAQNLLVRNAYSYGIGFSDGAHRNVVIESVTVHDTGADGIDFKNKLNRNESIRLNNISVRRWGLRKDLTDQAGIDCRGSVNASNVRIIEPGAADCVGFRLRHGEVGSPNGRGGHGSRLAEFAIVMGNGAAQIGLNIVAREVAAVGGTIRGGVRGVVVQDSGCRCTSVAVQGCADTGFLVNAGDSGLEADRTILTDCQVTDCGDDGFDIEADAVELVRCVARQNRRRGLMIRPTANGTRIRGGSFVGNLGASVVDRGSETSGITLN